MLKPKTARMLFMVISALIAMVLILGLIAPLLVR